MTLREMAEKAAQDMLDEVEFNCGAEEKPHKYTIADAIERIAKAFGKRVIPAVDVAHCSDHGAALDWCDRCDDAIIATAERGE